MNRYKILQAAVKRLQSEDKLPVWPTEEQTIGWAYGNAAMENPDVTMEIVRDAMIKVAGQRSSDESAK